MINIVIIGGGFAGINLAKHLKDKKGIQITLVDRNNYNFFPPLLYQVATGFLEPSNICFPYRKLFRGATNIRFQMGEFLRVIPIENKVVLSTGELFYDHLVFATGAQTNYFGMENVRKNSLPMKTVNDALELRNHFLQTLEQACMAKDEAERRKLLTIVIAGAGPTGVEVSGMLADMKKHVIPKDYPEIHAKGYESHIYVVDGGAAVLGPMSKASQAYTHGALAKMGVEVKLNCQVKDFVDGTVSFTNGETIDTKTLVWAAGVSASVLNGLPPECYGRGKRLIVDEVNRIQDFSNIYAIGDTCLQTSDTKFPSGHPQLAQVAIQQGNNLAMNFILMKNGMVLKAFNYWDKGSMAIIGRNKAVVDLPKPELHLKGFIAWFMWIFVHLMSLVNYRNRIKTFYNWAGAYFTKDQSLRFILRPSKKETASSAE